MFRYSTNLSCLFCAVIQCAYSQHANYEFTHSSRSLEKQLEKHNPDVYRALAGGLAADRVKALLAKVDIQSLALTAWYDWHNGIRRSTAGTPGVFPGWDLLSLNEALKTYKMLIKPHYLFIPSDWKSGWFPIFHTGGSSFIYLDLSQEKAHKTAGLYSFDAEGEHHKLEYDSLTSFVQTMAAAYDNQDLEFVSNQLVVKNKRDFARLRMQYNPVYKRELYDGMKPQLAISKYIGELNSGDGNAMGEAASKLMAWLDPQAIPRLSKSFQNKDPNVRSMVLRILADYDKDPRIQRVCLNGLKDKSPSVRQEAALLASKHKIAAACGSLARLLKRNTSNRVMTPVVYAIGEIRCPIDSQKLIRVYPSVPGHIQDSIIQTLGRLHADIALDLIIQRLQHPNPQSVLTALTALREIGDLRALPSIRKLEHNRNVDIARTAADTRERILKRHIFRH